MKLTVPPIEIDPKEGFTSEKDIFRRKVFGENLINIVSNVNDELVLAIDAPWGEGKTTFIKMWRGMLSENDIKSIYFDAFENDYQQDSFLAIAAEIYSLIDENKEEEQKQFKKKTVSALKTLARVGLRVWIKTATAGILDETIFDKTNTIKDISKEASDFVDSYVAKRLENAAQDKETLLDFKHSLEELAFSISNDKPLVFIIDELDRCKPPFALEILENIKHLYSVKNIVFVLIMNRSQIEESVKCEYGSGVEASKYLQKFVHVWASLPKNNNDGNYDVKKYLLDCLKRMNFQIETSEQQDGKKLYEELVAYYNLSLREIERSLTNYSLIHNMIGRKLGYHYQLILVYLSIIKVIKPKSYQKLSNNSISYEQLISETLLEDIVDNWLKNYKSNEYIASLTLLLKYCLSSEKEYRSFLETNTGSLNMNFFNPQDKTTIKRICKWMNNFEII